MDPNTTSLEFVLQPLSAVAGDREVRLRWEVTDFDDVIGFQLYRTTGGEALQLATSIPADSQEFVDTQVENGTTYQYELSLLIDGELETRLRYENPATATPGEEICWVGDPTASIVWKISPDGRTAHFGRGVAGLTGIAANLGDGSLWITSRFVQGVGRVGSGEEDAIVWLAAEVESVSSIAYDSEAERGWLIDEATARVLSFESSVEADVADTLILNPVDANFMEVSALAAADGACWIADRAAGRVLLYGIESGIRAEYLNLDAPQALAAREAESAWVLVAEGDELILLDQNERSTVTLPFTARAIDADRDTGDCWVLGDAELAVVNAFGAVVWQDDGNGGGQAIFHDGRHGRVWVGALGTLAKRTSDGRLLTLLGGFSTPSLIAVDPGRP